jgi:hypothetical protein
MTTVSVWKVRGLRGLSVQEMYVTAYGRLAARQYARKILGFWLVLHLEQV